VKVDEEVIQESWSINKLTKDNKVFLLRFNAWLWNVLPVEEYSYKLGIAINLKMVDSSGFPSADENKQLGKIEDKIIQIFQTNGKSIFVGTITGGGIKEFVFYAQDPDNIKVELQEFNKKMGAYDLQLNIQEDIDWEVFQTLCPNPLGN